MTIMDSVKKMAKGFGGDHSLVKPVRRSMDDDETTDQHLRYLRRETRRINEGYEKKRLTAYIHSEYRKQNWKMFDTPKEENLTRQKNFFKTK